MNFFNAWEQFAKIEATSIFLFCFGIGMFRFILQLFFNFVGIPTKFDEGKELKSANAVGKILWFHRQNLNVFLILYGVIGLSLQNQFYPNEPILIEIVALGITSLFFFTIKKLAWHTDRCNP